MIYTKAVQKKMDDILKAFADYIDGQNYFDIVYSKKIGYVWIVVDEPGAAGAEQLDSPEAILRTIEGGTDEYLDYLDSYLKDYKERCHGDSE